MKRPHSLSLLAQRATLLAIFVLPAFLFTPTAFALDQAAPSSMIESPAPGANLPVGTAVSIRGTAQDFGGGKVQLVEVSTDGGATWSRATGTTSWSLNWAPRSAGALTIVSRATDDAGNTEEPLGGVPVTTFAPLGETTSQTETTTTSTKTPSTAAATSSAPLSAARVFEDTTAAHFSAGTVGSGLSVVSQKGDGELILTPDMTTEFTTFPADWIKVEAPLGTGSAVAQNDELFVENAFAHPAALFMRPRSVEFRATFRGPGQAVGVGSTLALPPWARFHTDSAGQLHAETNSGIGTPTAVAVILPNAVGQPHVFRIEWSDAGISYYIDGELISSHATIIAADLRPVVRDDTRDGSAVSVAWMRSGGYPSSATYLSRIFDYGSKGRWKTATWVPGTPGAAPIAVCVRSGPTATPDARWNDWVCPASGATAPTLTVRKLGRYAQYRATLSSSAVSTPELQAVQLQVEDACAEVIPGCVEQSNPPCSVFVCNPGGDDQEPFCEPVDTNGTVCDPGDLCATGVCDSGSCVGSEPILCNDDNPCTSDTCSPASGCVFEALTCPDDGNVCTQDVCNPETGGCGVVLAGQSCADGDLCDGTETCNSAGTCVAGTPVVCQDTNACTDDVCDPATGQCSFVNDNTNQCSDGLFCTVNDRCENGACVSTPRNCGDANACTPDTCDETNDTCVNGPVPQETCDGADNDCDGKIDEGFPRAKMTGGGQILVGSSKRTFGFNAKGTVGGKDKGEFNYVNHTTKNHIKGEVTQIFFQCDCESMFRVRTRDGCYYVVTADDNGEPGKGNDRFGLEYEPENPSYCPKETTGGPKPLSAGNIQCHAHHDADEDDDDHGDCEKPDENDKKDHNHRR